MNIELLKKLAHTLEEAGEHDEAEEVRKMVDEEEPKNHDENKKERHNFVIEVSGESEEDLIKAIYKTLYELADKLDENGSVKEASIVDSLIKKMAEDPKNIQTALIKFNTESNAFFKTLDNLRSIVNIDNEMVDFNGILKSIRAKLTDIPAVAMFLKAIGMTEESEFIQKIAADWNWEKPNYSKYDAKSNNEKTHLPQLKPQKKTRQHHKEEYQEVGDKTLSTRYCPVHVGVSMHRVGEGVYRCPLDGKTYNWEEGYTDEHGKKHPGGSISGQTEIATNIPISHRLLDARQDMTNKIN